MAIPSREFPEEAGLVYRFISRKRDFCHQERTAYTCTYQYSLEQNISIPVLLALIHLCPPQVAISRHRIIARFGLMHMIGTNLCIWLNVLVQETKHEIINLRFGHGGHHGGEALLLAHTVASRQGCQTFMCVKTWTWKSLSKGVLWCQK